MVQTLFISLIFLLEKQNVKKKNNTLETHLWWANLMRHQNKMSFSIQSVLLFESNIKDMRVMDPSEASQWVVEYFHSTNYIELD